MLSLIVGLPGLIALVVCLRRGTEQAFLSVYLPTLLLLPGDYRWPITGHFNFYQAAITPIAVWFLLGSWRTWKFSVTDVLLLGYCATTVISQIHNTNFADARHTALYVATNVLFPYMLAKGLLWRGNFGLEVAKRLAILLTIVSIISVYEFKMTVNLFEDLVRVFLTTNSAEFSPGSFRYGLTRVAGPFGHPLAAGIILLASYRFVRWLEWNGYWPQRIALLNISAVRFCELSILVGAAMTLTRGPWIGAAIGSLTVWLGRARNRGRSLAVAIALFLVVGLPIYWGVRGYILPDPGQETSIAQHSATYRVNLITAYLPIIEERPALGYGQGWDKFGQFQLVNGMWSIDNEYLLIALINGLYALALWVGVFAWIFTRLLWFGLRRPGDDLQGWLAWTLAGACTLYALELATVYLGDQTGFLLYMIWGWSEGFLLSTYFVTRRASQNLGKLRPTAVRWKRVMAGVIVPVSGGMPSWAKTVNRISDNEKRP